MNKTAIKNFAVWARRKLISDISYKAGLLGITENGIANPLPQSTNNVQFFDIGMAEPYSVSGVEIKQRKNLVEHIEDKAKGSDYKTAYTSVIEEVAYTWFNRLIAIRFMEVNDYLPSHIRVLSSESGKQEPDIVTNPCDAELFINEEEKLSIMQLKLDNKLDELFRILFIKQCNALYALLPRLFENLSDYTELLLNISFIDQEGVVAHLINDIDADDFDVEKGGQVEIIGWLYQYYNTELKEETFDLLKNNVKITKERIPSATQLFTPDWIVRYMVENSLGRIWYEGHKNEDLKGTWKYYLDEAEQESKVQAELNKIYEEHAKLNPEDIKVIDPCMGSGHILVYAFDVLMQIYESSGYTQRDAAKLILEKNIYGLDIDDRAAQLAYFSIMMRARQYNRKILNVDTICNVIAITDSKKCDKLLLGRLGNFMPLANRLVDTFENGKELGSIIDVGVSDFELNDLEQCINDIDAKASFGNLIEQYESAEIKKQLLPLITQARLLNMRYDVVVTNPPYMGFKGMNSIIFDYLKAYYGPYKSDIFSAFIVKCISLNNRSGYASFLSPYVWMFIQSYEQLRNYVCEEHCLQSLVQLEYSAFEEATVPICTFVVQNARIHKVGSFLRLTDFKGGMSVQREKALVGIANHSCGYYYETNPVYFKYIPETPIAYWVSKAMLSNFKKGSSLGLIAEPKSGLSTTDNLRFLRMWSEVEYSNISYCINDIDETIDSTKWFPIVKGGEYRKWAGNDEYVVDWKDNGRNIKDATKGAAGGRIVSPESYFKTYVTWSGISSGEPSMRLSEKSIFGSGAKALLATNGLLDYLAFLNSKVALEILKFLSPTLNYEAGHIGKIPICFSNSEEIENIALENVNISKEDWGAFETSRDFKKHPLI